MTRFFIAQTFAAFAPGCASRAVGKDGSGAARSNFMAIRERDA